MKIKLSPFWRSPATPNRLAPVEKTFDPCDMIPMPEHWATLLANPIAGSTSPSLGPLFPGSGGGTILVAEDNKKSILILKAALEKAGYASLIVNDGLEAMVALRKPDAPSIAVLDWMLPKIDGLEICRRVRELNKSVYVIFLTARATTKSLVQALEAGADDYLTKPFKSAELIARIHVGFRIVNLQKALRNHVEELERALAEIRALRGPLSNPL
jgi:CheY-like chemotaxis protein